MLLGCCREALIEDADLLLSISVFIPLTTTPVDKVGRRAHRSAHSHAPPMTTDTLKNTEPPWHLDRIDQRRLPLDGVALLSGIGLGATIYILDTGVRITHEELGDRAGYAAVSQNGDLLGELLGQANGADDCHGHGTHVAGIAAGNVLGVAPGAEIRAIRVADCSGQGDPQAAVAASDRQDKQMTFSNYGACVDLFAPGKGIRAACGKNDTALEKRDGSSSAAAVVAGAVALFLEQYPDATPCDVRSAAINSATTDELYLTKRSKESQTPNRLLYVGDCWGE
jgi:subtilisin family serine protease